MITFKNLSKDIPYILFKEKYERAESANQQNVEAMCISSYSKNTKEVNARFVNLKLVEDRNFIFFSNYESPKSRDFESHAQITALFYWSSIDTQIRMKANIEKTPADYNQKYFTSIFSYTPTILKINKINKKLFFKFSICIECVFRY